jgi:hypothetical protein
MPVDQGGEHYVSALLRAEQSAAPDCLQRPLLRVRVEAMVLRCTQIARYVDTRQSGARRCMLVHINSIQQSMQDWLRVGRFLHWADHIWDDVLSGFGYMLYCRTWQHKRQVR